MEKFKPRKDQIDFTNARWAPVINCLVKFQNKILLVRRSKEINFYPGYWNGISGFLDDQKSLFEKVHEELKEELGLDVGAITKIHPGQVFDQEEPVYKKTWIVHPVLVEFNTDVIKTDWEADSFIWLSVDETRTKKLLPGFELVLSALGL